jgi:LmbE family N-acetylglucosaminyl deacetylase
MKILAVGPHPDDVEFGCAPVLIQEVKKGHEARIIVVSRGEASTSGTPMERVQEAGLAADIIGASLEFLDLGGDCHIESTVQNRFKLARELRRFKPNIVLAPHLDPNQHPDHSAVAGMVRDASRLARYGGLEELRDLAPHSIDHLYYYSITQTFGQKPDIVVDVSGVHTEWVAVMACHQTQMRTRSYLELVEGRARSLGAAIGVDYAIGLWVNDPICLESISDLWHSSRHY